MIEQKPKVKDILTHCGFYNIDKTPEGLRKTFPGLKINEHLELLTKLNVLKFVETQKIKHEEQSESSKALMDSIGMTFKKDERIEEPAHYELSDIGYYIKEHFTIFI